MAVIIYNTLRATDRVIVIGYSDYMFEDDDVISEWAKKRVKYLATVEILSGDDEHRFNPANNLTRKEAAKVVAALVSGGTE